ncbi:hypothetical protein [uncultured Schumannella sp.]|uniref:hypothetical protein n=1 Tax=uncultured Schumannella sp. TaxID=1195956 RepID=UPI0025FF66BD|nr:hypothetical protein [uncultured Schumannella sp.]
MGFLAPRGRAREVGEQFGETWAKLLVVGDFQLRVECLICEPPVRDVGVRVGVVGVGAQPQGVVEERPRPCVVFI